VGALGVGFGAESPADGVGGRTSSCSGTVLSLGGRLSCRLAATCWLRAFRRVGASFVHWRRAMVCLPPWNGPAEVPTIGRRGIVRSG